jgi:hypothetical protein
VNASAVVDNIPHGDDDPVAHQPGPPPAIYCRGALSLVSRQCHIASTANVVA